jgi:curved DNA-binding protein CbpA
MSNYYEILQIRLEATKEEIRVAFRALAKKYHPDYHPDRGAWAHDRIREILRAYEVLKDDKKRAIYDRTLAHIANLKTSRRHRDELKKRKDDPKSCCKLIFLDLLEGRGLDALFFYEEMSAKHASFNLKDHMPITDYLDCSFLLAEEYERQHKLETAFRHYAGIFNEDKRYNYFKHFRGEILLRLYKLALRFMETKEQIPLALSAYTDILAHHLQRRERAFLYKKFAECFLKNGERKLARLNILCALMLQPRLGGSKKIRKSLAIGCHRIGCFSPAGIARP